MMTTAQIKGLAERYEKAVELVEQGRVAPVYGQANTYAVLNGEGYAYLVNLAQETCSCPDAQYRAKRLNIPCKHQIAAALFAERQQQPASGKHSRKSANGAEPEPAAQPAPAAEDTPVCQRCGTPTNGSMYCVSCARELLYGEVA
ncbi:MAG: SWIM zinc finger family protein [Thermorudis peleae]|nr:SWIM zinc finger family protein [Thermorudis peleae]